MFTIKYKDMTSPYFTDAYQFLSVQKLPIKVAYNIKKMGDTLQKARKQIADEYQKDIVEKYTKKNADGTIAHPKDAEGNELKDQFDLDESQKEAMKETVEKFGERELKVDRYKLVMEDLDKVELSASHLAALDPILTTLEEIASNATTDEKAAG